MKVELVQATENPVKLITDVASICYGKEEASHPDKLIRHLFENGHHSTFEHIYYTFKIEGISRACLGQLTRHRHASYSVRSQRYCDESEQDYIIPEKLLGNLSYGEDNYIDIVRGMYDKLIKIGVKKEDARMILPMATATDLYMSCNLRELIHINNLRNSRAAQREIRLLANELIRLAGEAEPDLMFMFDKKEVK